MYSLLGEGFDFDFEGKDSCTLLLKEPLKD